MPKTQPELLVPGVACTCILTVVPHQIHLGHLGEQPELGRDRAGEASEAVVNRRGFRGGECGRKRGRPDGHQVVCSCRVRKGVSVTVSVGVGVAHGRGCTCSIVGVGVASCMGLFGRGRAGGAGWESWTLLRTKAYGGLCWLFIDVVASAWCW